MQSADNAPPNDPFASLPMANPTMKPLPSKQRGQPLILDSRPHSQPEAQPTTPIRERRTNPSAASLFRSTLTPPGSRSGSPAPMGSPARSLTGSVFGSGGFKQSLLDTAAAENPGDPLNLILKSFVPHIAIHDSEDVEHLVKEKGFKGGLFELLRPFGERVQGRVTIRDSNGASRTWDDFSVRFTKFGEAVEDPDTLPDPRSLRGPPPNGQPTGQYNMPRKKTSLVQQVEQVVEKHLGFAEEASMGTATPTTPTRQGLDTDATSPYYALYLRRLLSGIPMASHETFSHPVACVIAISSRHPAPIEALRQLYSETTPAEQRIPPWVDGDFLRYYVLVHDEERSDITKSMQLFDQMKRHFGLHCHLLRIRSSQSAETDDDSIPLPRSDWMSASEELADIERSEQLQDSFDDDPHLFNRYIFESDATAIRTFIREMVIQSIIPTMERNVSLWNDQVASRRRGISGRFMSLSKRFTVFGSSSSSRNSTSSSSNGFDTLGYYRPDTPEAIMRRLADFAFMLRDWKLAMSTYDLLRTDFQNDKAWKYHASANEMAALSLLIMPQNMSSKNRVEIINPMVEQALYSYHTRCSSLYGAVRSTLLSLELLRLRGGTGIDESVRWGTRLLEMRLFGPIGDALLRERLAVCYASKRGTGSQLWGSRRRKSAMWSVLAAQAWVSMGKYLQAQKCLADARRMYSLLPSEWGVQGFNGASEFLAGLNEAVREGLRVTREYAEALEAEGGHSQGGNREGEEGEGLGLGLQFDESSNLTIRPKAADQAAATGTQDNNAQTEVDVDVEQDGFNGQSSTSSQLPSHPPQIPTPTASSKSPSPETARDSDPAHQQLSGGFEDATPTSAAPSGGNSPTRPRKASMAVRTSRVLSAADLEPAPLSPFKPARLASASGSRDENKSKEGKDGGFG